MPVRAVIERGPKGKRSVAFGIDWPGWSRGAKSAELALETLESYRKRYRPVAGLAGMAEEFDAAGPLEIVEDKVGTGSTDFWGISFSPAATEQEPMGEAELERGITLLRACWTYFDGVAARVSPEMRKGPRGADATATGSSATRSAPRARTSPRRSGCGSPRVRRSPRMACAGIGRPTSRRCAPTTPGRSSGACGPGHSHSSSDTPPTTPSTMPGRWRTRTSPPRTGPDPPPFDPPRRSALAARPRRRR